MNKKLVTAITAFGLSIAGVSYAQEVDKKFPLATDGLYFGFGFSQFATNTADVTESADEYTKFDSQDTGYNLFVGKRVGKFFAFEGGFSDFGDIEYKGLEHRKGDADNDGNDISTNFTIKVSDSSALYLDGFLIAPIAKEFQAFVKGGVNYYEGKTTNTNLGKDKAVEGEGINRDTISSSELRSLGVNYGFGLQYIVQDAFGVRVSYTDFRFDNAKEDKFPLLGGGFGALDFFYIF